MTKFDPLAALARQQRLAAATRSVVDARLRQFTPVDAGLPNSQSCETNPICSADSSRAASGKRDVARGTLDSSSKIVAGAVDAGLHQLTAVDPGLPIQTAPKTNPNPSDVTWDAPATLSPRQLAAARLLARGQHVAEVAAEMRVSRQALWKWRRSPAFVAELGRLHELMARQVAGRR